MRNPNLKIALLLIAGFVAGMVLSVFTRNVDVAQAIGLAVIIAGTTLFIGAVLTCAGFGIWLIWLAAVDGFEGIVEALDKAGIARRQA